MSSPSHSHHLHHRTTASHGGRSGSTRAQSAAAVSQHVSRAHAATADYTLVHGGRQVRIGPVAFWIVVGTLVTMAVWSVGTGTYFAFREDVLSGLISRHARMQIAYEDRIASLRAEVDRITSRQLLDQNQFDHRLDGLLKRQAKLERRTAELAKDGLVTGSIPHPANPKEAAFKLPRGAFSGDGAGLQGTLTHVSQSLDHIEQYQTAMVGGMAQQLSAKARRMHSVLSGLGIKAGLPPAEGGPFIPLKAADRSTGDFNRLLHRVHLARAAIKGYRHTLASVPVRKPLPGELDVTSGFGARSDPFLGSPAFHPGLDLRGEIGEPVHATADGKVERAGWDGGYGNLVEIENGHGMVTRFGHLSKILVKGGQRIHAGQVIGLIGSTGRSTGPHLHYETRIDGKPVDPDKFLRAGITLGRL